MHAAKSAKLPKHPDWDLRADSRPEQGRLTLTYGSNELHIRFWPRASAMLRRSPEGKWQDGSRHAERVLRASLKGPKPKEIHLYRETHLVDPSGQLVFDFIREISPDSLVTGVDLALRSALQTIPTAIRESLRQLHRSEWPALQIASRLRAAAELLPSHPQLFWLWLRHYRLAPRTNPNPNRLIYLKLDLQHPRRNQLSKLGFTSAKTWLRILAKVPSRHMHRIDWEALAQWSRSAPDQDILKRMLHASAPLSASLLQALATPDTRRWLSLDLLKTSLQHPRFDIHACLAAYDQFLQAFPTLKAEVKLPNRIKDLERERKRIESILIDHRQYRDHHKTSPFPCPAGWTHLEKFEALTEEGFRQENCLSDRAGLYIADSGNIYRVEHPVRATLHVDTSPEGHCYVRECRGPRNSPIPGPVERDLLYTLLDRQMPSINEIERRNYSAGPVPSTPLYQRITNSRALWALHQAGKIPFLPEALEGPLLRGEKALYQIRRPQPYIIEMKWQQDFGWDLHRLLHVGVRTASPTPFMVATHILWEHCADLHHHGFPVPAWQAPEIESLTDYQPVDNIWKLLQFRWATGTCISVEDIQKGKELPFYCRIGGRQLAAVAGSPTDDCCHIRYYLHGGRELDWLDDAALQIEAELNYTLNYTQNGMPASDGFHRSDATEFTAPPQLPSLREAKEWLTPEFQEVCYPEYYPE